MRKTLSALQKQSEELTLWTILFVVPVKLLIDFLMKKLLTNGLNNSLQGKIYTIWIVGHNEILYRKLIECEGLKQSLIRTSNIHSSW